MARLGVPLRLRLLVTDESCQPLDGYAVYIWHCDQAGRYSMYTSGAENENYLRGAQETDAESDMVFSDGVTLELPSITGSAEAGYIATLQVTIKA